MDSSGILHFRSMFDLVKQDPYEVNMTQNNIIDIIMIEYTISINHTQLSKLTKDQQIDKYEKLIQAGLNALNNHFKNEVHYYEQTADKVFHVHGKFDINRHVIIEGVIKTFVKAILQTKDKRLTMRENECWYQRLLRYRSPLICCQYSDTMERHLHWEQYIQKEQ